MRWKNSSNDMNKKKKKFEGIQIQNSKNVQKVEKKIFKSGIKVLPQIVVLTVKKFEGRF